jgi:hypothetical protein
LPAPIVTAPQDSAIALFALFAASESKVALTTLRSPFCGETFMRNGVTGLIFSLGLVGLCSVASSANAAFIATTVEPTSGELKFFAGSANKDVSTFTGNVGGQNSGPQVTVDTIGNVNTDAGYGAIKPVMEVAGGSVLTNVTFTPLNPNLFNDFFFRGQLVNDGSVTLKVNDSLGDPAQVFTFDNLKANTNFGSLGIVLDLAFPNDFSTIKSIELISAGFKELKQIDFSSAKLSAVPLPASLQLFGVALLALGTVRAFSRGKSWSNSHRT